MFHISNRQEVGIPLLEVEQIWRSDHHLPVCPTDLLHSEPQIPNAETQGERKLELTWLSGNCKSGVSQKSRSGDHREPNIHPVSRNQPSDLPVLGPNDAPSPTSPQSRQNAKRAQCAQLRLVQGPEESNYGHGPAEIHDSPTAMSRSGQDDVPPPSYDTALGRKS